MNYKIIEYSALRNREEVYPHEFTSWQGAQALADILNRKNPFYKYYVIENTEDLPTTKEKNDGN